MKPRLILLTGPAADEAARVLREMCDFIRLAPLPEAAAWDEVRDYWRAPQYISDHFCEEWLVGLVLPRPGLCMSNGHRYPPDQPVVGCEGCRSLVGLPARLAILAPDPPPLLVERLRAWGGEMWHCCNEATEDDGRPCSIYNQAWPDEPRDAATWPEAVRMALGAGEA